MNSYVISGIFVCYWLMIAHGQDVETQRKEEFYSRFQEYNEVIDYLRKMERKYPNLIELETLGYTVENREILLAKIGTKIGRGRKPGIWIDSAMHAREWISCIVREKVNYIDSMKLHKVGNILPVHKITFHLEYLAKKYDTDNATRDYVDKLEWYILPMMNPDGYEFSREKNAFGSRSHFLWRKNRRPSDCAIENCNCYGVDLNRNFGYHWGMSAVTGGHASNDSCDDQYIGPKPFSERESFAVQDFILRHSSTLKAYFTLHSYAQMWFYPYGYQRGTYPDDYSELHNLAMRATEALRAMYGTAYQVGSSADIYYPAAGAAVDWVKGVANVKYVYGVELRPHRDTEMAAFLLPWEEIEPTCKETFAAIKIVADEVIKNYV